MLTANSMENVMFFPSAAFSKGQVGTFWDLGHDVLSPPILLIVAFPIGLQDMNLLGCHAEAA